MIHRMTAPDVNRKLGRDGMIPLKSVFDLWRDFDDRPDLGEVQKIENEGYKRNCQHAKQRKMFFVLH